MRWSLFLLSLMGQFSVFICHLYDYIFINENKTWDEAQTYCREKYTDLATVSDMTDMKRLIKSTQSQDEAWIGLHSYPGKDNRTWYWSLPGVEYIENKNNWTVGQPDDNAGRLENCALLTNKKFQDYPCTSKHRFVCYNETNQANKTCHVIDYFMTWPKAQNYCREIHTDLVSGLDQLDVCDVCAQSVSYVWIGLFRDTWRWSDGSNSSFRHWESLSNNDLVDGQSKKTCATTVLNRAGRWSFDYCRNKKPFICYGDTFILIRKNMTWVEALNYCRENYYDLVSITDPHDQRLVQETVKNASSPYVWLGLRYSCTLDFWFWVSDSRVNYTNWAPQRNADDCDMSAAMETGNSNQWFKQPDNETFNFICF
ncbi:hypothetical protein Q5P01_002476 [Channa striata]|uniref:C-type lectin domain-containing protein n=1 Tax=Channa striata TaxID=64152 RepID=A0AA88P0Q7_CHASR|nr:hypothetical protein Q5P01_002476 [Channa striata]